PPRPGPAARSADLRRPRARAADGARPDAHGAAGRHAVVSRVRRGARIGGRAAGGRRSPLCRRSARPPRLELSSPAGPGRPAHGFRATARRIADRLMSSLFVWLARFGCALALIVVTVGAWVRLTDAGLGCPDWPGCYGEIFVTESLTIPPDVEAQYGRPLEAGKAWREMFHRYLASTLGLVCVALGVLAWINRK